MDSLASCVSSRNPDAKARADRARNPAWIGDITNKVRTGDLLLFSSKHSTSNITKFFTRSRWDHIGIVVKPSPTRAYIVEWGGGLFACELVERLNEYAEWDAMELVLRHLNLKADRRAVEERIEKFVDMLFREKLGQNRGVPLGKVVSAARDQMFSGNTRSYDSAHEVYVDDLKALFCSKTVAVTYKAAGLLGANRISDKFLPKHFSIGHDSFLELQGGAYLGPEQRVTFESRRMHDMVSNVLSLPILEHVGDALYLSNHKEQKAALLIEKFVRRVSAKREMRRRKEMGYTDKREESRKMKLYSGAEEHGHKARNELLRRLSLQPHARPSETLSLQVTWIDEAEPHEGVGPENGQKGWTDVLLDPLKNAKDMLI